MITKQELIDFEEDIADCFNRGLIRAPIHLYDGNEDLMLEVFEKIDKNDWILCTWRSHYQALCKGVPKELLKEKILLGRSMVLSFPEYKMLSSSIVGGIPPIATGIAFSIKKKIEMFQQGKISLTPEEYAALKKQKVWCWIGDMSSETGSFHESFKYSVNFKLPITFIIESNGKSVTTPTAEVWGYEVTPIIPSIKKDTTYQEGPNYIYYRYQNNKYPHAGAGKRINF